MKKKKTDVGKLFLINLNQNVISSNIFLINIIKTLNVFLMDINM